MNQSETVRIVSRHLPHVPRHIIAEVLEVTGEVWADELTRSGHYVNVLGLGRLHVDAQYIRPSGAIRKKMLRDHGTVPDRIRRLYFRFRPSGWFKQQVEDAHHEETSHEEN